MKQDFMLDERLQADTFFIADLPLSRALLMNDQRYCWIILVPRRANLTELYQLDEDDTKQLWKESRLLSEILMKQVGGKKLNVAALGNVVSQLHLHHVVRNEGDPAWPGPVWGQSPAQPYEQKNADKVCETLSVLLLKS